MSLIQDKFFGEEGKALIARKLSDFRDVISKLEEVYNVRPFNQQTVQSLTELYLLILAIQPKSVFEVGCGSRSSTIALASATAELDITCPVFGLDIAPVPFSDFVKTHFKELRFGPVIDIAANATQFLLPVEWQQPIFTLYDAHDDDIPGHTISTHAINSWFSRLKGQVVAVHDCSVFKNDSRVEVGPEYTTAYHFSDRKVIGYKEVSPLVNWMNKNRVDFYRPADELKALGFEADGSSLIYFTIP